VILDQTQWPRGKQLTVVEVKPPPDGMPYVLRQVTLVPRGKHEPQFSLWCQAQESGTAPLQEQDVVAVKNKTSSSVLVERLIQEVPDGLQCLLVIPPIEEEPDSVFNRMYHQVITILALNTGPQILTWKYILIAYCQLEALALELLRLHKGTDEQTYWESKAVRKKTSMVRQTN